MRRGLALVIIGALAACSGKEAPPAPSPTPAATAESAPATPATPARALNTVRSQVRTVDLQGEPLPGMTPIATLQPNAFDEPIATGPLTNAEGRTELLFPGDQQVCVRAWDPDLHYFANNFVEVLPNTGDATGEITIIMVPGAAIHATLLLPDGAPAANRNAGMMMFHPTRGPWWPSEANTDAQGHALFQNLPAGRFMLKFKVDTGESIELPDISLGPASENDLGVVTLQ